MNNKINFQICQSGIYKSHSRSRIICVDLTDENMRTILFSDTPLEPQPQPDKYRKAYKSIYGDYPIKDYPKKLYYPDDEWRPKEIVILQVVHISGTYVLVEYLYKNDFENEFCKQGE